MIRRNFGGAWWYLALMALPVVLFSTAAQAGFSDVFNDRCHITVENEVSALPYDNALKYSALAGLSFIPQTAVAAQATLTEEGHGGLSEVA